MKIDSKLGIAATTVAILLGFFIGRYYREILCIRSFETSAETDPNLSQPCPGGSHMEVDGMKCIPPTIDNSMTFVHTNHFRTIDNSVLNTVFKMLHHPSCPDTAETVLTTSEEWNNDFSVCQTVYAVRSPVREDHPNKCYAVYRAPASDKSQLYHSTTGICHRTGSIEWPQVLTDQYQVIFIIFSIFNCAIMLFSLRRTLFTATHITQKILTHQCFCETEQA